MTQSIDLISFGKKEEMYLKKEINRKKAKVKYFNIGKISLIRFKR